MGLIDDVGAWAWVADAAASYEQKSALFLDRDGVIVHETDFLSRPEHVVLVPGAGDTIAAFNRANVPVIVVTNQSGIARGHFSWAEFETVETEIAKQLAEAAGAHLDAVFACGYHGSGTGSLARGDHPWRKPNPGMLWAATELLGVRLETSWIVGDRARDLATGRAAGLAGGVHVGTGYGGAKERRASLALANSDFQVEPSADITGALQLCNRMAEQADH